MQIIPIKPLPHQQIYYAIAGVGFAKALEHFSNVTLQCSNYAQGVQTQIDILQRRTGLFADIYMNEKLVVAGVICQDRNTMVKSAYLGFPGDLAFVDQLGTSDPTVDGLGTRFLLCFLEPGEHPFDPVVPEG